MAILLKFERKGAVKTTECNSNDASGIKLSGATHSGSRVDAWNDSFAKTIIFWPVW